MYFKYQDEDRQFWNCVVGKITSSENCVLIRFRFCTEVHCSLVRSIPSWTIQYTVAVWATIKRALLWRKRDSVLKIFAVWECRGRNCLNLNEVYKSSLPSSAMLVARGIRIRKKLAWVMARDANIYSLFRKNWHRKQTRQPLLSTAVEDITLLKTSA